ncbi:MAG: restriction endonuclease subunit S, partial [Spirochaetota bacterium]
KAKEFFGYGTPIVNYMDVFARGTIRPAQVGGRVFVTPQEQCLFGVRPGDVLFTRTSETVDEVGIAAVVEDAVPGTVFSGFVLRGRPIGNDLDRTYCRYCFNALQIREQIVSKATYTTRALTNGHALSSVQLNLPPLPEQRAIAAVLSDMDAEIAALERRREKTRLVKQGMMQELLTGRIRLLKPTKVEAGTG